MLKKAGLLLLLGFIVIFSIQVVYAQSQLTISSYSISGSTLTVTVKNTGTTSLALSSVYVDNKQYVWNSPPTVSAGSSVDFDINNVNIAFGQHNIRVICSDGTQATLTIGTNLGYIVLVFIVVFVILALVGYFTWSMFSRSRKQKTETQSQRVMPYSPNSSAYQLTSMGFEQVGTFWRSNGLQFSLASHANDAGIYAFVIGDEIKYIGKTHSLVKRMVNYRDAEANDDYHDRSINQELMYNGQSQILFLPRWIIDSSDPSRFNIPQMNEKLTYHTVEYILISRYKPPWNYEGSRD